MAKTIYAALADKLGRPPTDSEVQKEVDRIVGYDRKVSDPIVAQVNKYNTYVRLRDGKEFKVVFYSHWSDIESADGEKFAIKWLGGTDTIDGKTGESYVAVNGERFVKFQINRD